jgi:hypothetical protein
LFLSATEENMMSDISTLQNPRLVVITALITAVTSIGVSVVGIFPQLQARTMQPDKTITTSAAKPAEITPPAQEKWSIRGEVVDSSSRQPVKNADVVLVPMTGQNISITGNDGSFELSGVPAGTYALIVREPDGGGSRVMFPKKRADGSDILMGEAPDLKNRPKTFVTYKIEKR